MTATVTAALAAVVRRGNAVGFVLCAVCFTVFAAGWAFGLEFLEARLLRDPAPWWAR